ncbi:MAG TPA: AbrB/MazE/SpoVT family DNA-binding domain-containing protein [Afifellaceae bacterium]|nr:AbrB/MazE/SpoVT family DNA-binding domain-containing protein [Afifellaceae bacterium]
MRVTEKGQVTIPKHIRDKTGIRPGTEVDFRLEDGKVVVLRRPADESACKRRAREIKDYLERVRGIGDAGLTADEIMDMTRGPFDDIDPD